MIDKTVILYDYGLFIELAIRLAKDFKKVYYYMPWKSAFAKRNEYMVGYGTEAEGITKVDNFFSTVDECDLVVFPDIYDADLQEHLRSQGKLVWGNGQSEELELDRWKTRMLQKQIGIDYPETKRIVGMDKLREYLQEHDDKWLKVSRFRGDMETYHHINWFTSQPFIDDLANRMGAAQKVAEFILEENLADCIEVGYDGWTVDGDYPAASFYGYEIKDLGYVGRFAAKSDLPPALKSVNEKLAPIYRRNLSRGFISTEVRIGRDRVPYFIDPCVRCGSPPTEGLMECYKNLGEIIWEGAQGRLVVPVPEAKFCVIAMIYSEWAADAWMPIKFPKAARRWVKFKNLAIIDGKYYTVPQNENMPEIGAVVGIGNSVEECSKRIDEVAEQLEGYTLEVHNDSVKKAEEEIAEGRRYGINF